MDSLHYIQVVQSPMFVSAGSLLDHVYVKCSHCHIIKRSVLAVCYPEHDAIKNFNEFHTIYFIINDYHFLEPILTYK